MHCCRVHSKSRNNINVAAPPELSQGHAGATLRGQVSARKPGAQELDQILHSINRDAHSSVKKSSVTLLDIRHRLRDSVPGRRGVLTVVGYGQLLGGYRRGKYSPVVVQGDRGASHKRRCRSVPRRSERDNATSAGTVWWASRETPYASP